MMKKLIPLLGLLGIGGGLWGVMRLTQGITPQTIVATSTAAPTAAPVVAPAAPVVIDAQGAAQAFAEARAKGDRLRDLWLPDDEMLKLAEKAVALDGTKAPYLVYLTQIYISKRRNGDAIATAKRLLALQPEHPWGNVMLANLLLEHATDPKELAEQETRLNIAARDPNLAPAFHYGRGLLALRRKQGPLAVSELKQACDLDPHSGTGYYDLFLAEKMVGNSKAAEAALTKHDRIVAANTATLKRMDRGASQNK